MNFYVMDTREDDSQRAAGWSPPKVGDFHVPNRFGRVRFLDPSAPAPTPAAPVVPMPAGARDALKHKAIQQHLGLDRIHRPQGSEPVPTPENPRPTNPTRMTTGTAMTGTDTAMTGTGTAMTTATMTGAMTATMSEADTTME